MDIFDKFAESLGDILVYKHLVVMFFSKLEQFNIDVYADMTNPEKPRTPIDVAQKLVPKTCRCLNCDEEHDIVEMFEWYKVNEIASFALGMLSNLKQDNRDDATFTSWLIKELFEQNLSKEEQVNILAGRRYKQCGADLVFSEAELTYVKQQRMESELEECLKDIQKASKESQDRIPGFIGIVINLESKEDKIKRTFNQN